ncbi:MAG: ribonuclease P protein component [Duncaniella sp.]|nr:ribonuclease P protein component [Duncaniella sp.]MDE6581233.1 ribonuclease P protein component [Duncaniella sp.]
MSSPAHPLRLYKKEKLCSEIAIARVFNRTDPATSSASAYPLVASWQLNRVREIKCPRFLASIPKKKVRHAVDRVGLRRRVREAYRLHRDLIPADAPLDIAFVYVGKSILPYAVIEKSMMRLLDKINRSLDVDGQ